MKPVTREKKNLSAQERLFVENQNHCALCNSRLDIKIIRDQDEETLTEEAHCQKCRIKTRAKKHTVH